MGLLKNVQEYAVPNLKKLLRRFFEVETARDKGYTNDNAATVTRN